MRLDAVNLTHWFYKRIEVIIEETMAEKIVLTWSGGKDSAIVLHELQKTNDYEISALLTTITEDYDRISMHGVRSTLLDRQANSLGLPIEKIYIKKNESNEEYETKMRDKLK